MSQYSANSLLGACIAVLTVGAPGTAQAITLFDDDESRFDAVFIVQPELQFVQDPCAPGVECVGASWFASPDDSAREASPDGFYLGRARLALGGTHGIWSGNIVLDAAPRMSFVEAAIGIRPTDGVSLRIGQFKTPFGLSFLTSLHRRQLADAGEISLASIGRQPGAQVQLDSSSFSRTDAVALTLGVFTPAPVFNIGPTSGEQLATARLSISPFGQFAYAEGDLRSPSDRHDPLLRVGYSIAQSIGGGDEPTQGHSVDLAMQWEGVSLYAEWLSLEHRRVFADELSDTTGFRLQAGTFVPHPSIRAHLEFVVRYEDLEATGAMDRDLSELSVGANWYFDDNAKLQATYVSRSEGGSSSDQIDNDSIILQLTFWR